MRSLLSYVLVSLCLGIAVAACSSESGAAGPPAVATDTGGTDPVGAPSMGDADSGGSGSGAPVSGGKSDASTSDGASGSAPTCLEQLTMLGVNWEPTMARGVVDAVFIKDKINGVLFALEQQSTPATDPMACEFVLTLYKFADYLKSLNIEHVGTLGSYCYRCCCAWSMTNYCRGLNDPEPMCGAAGYSNHSWGRAIDIRWFYTTTGKVYDVNDPATFVQSTTPTCTAAATQTGDSKFLYDLVCGEAADHIFSTALTPNYNSAHRNHFHLDIGQSGPPKGFTVQSRSLDVDVPNGLNNSCGDE
jgi:hypothetical protein